MWFLNVLEQFWQRLAVPNPKNFRLRRCWKKSCRMPTILYNPNDLQSCKLQSCENPNEIQTIYNPVPTILWKIQTTFTRLFPTTDVAVCLTYACWHQELQQIVIVNPEHHKMVLLDMKHQHTAHAGLPTHTTCAPPLLGCCAAFPLSLHVLRTYSFNASRCKSTLQARVRAALCFMLRIAHVILRIVARPWHFSLHTAHLPETVWQLFRWYVKTISLETLRSLNRKIERVSRRFHCCFRLGSSFVAFL